MKGANVRLRGMMMQPRRASAPEMPSFLADPAALSTIFAQIAQKHAEIDRRMSQMHAMAAHLETGLARLDDYAKEWKALKKGDKGDAGMSPDFVQVVDALMKQVAPKLGELDDERLKRIAKEVVAVMPKPKKGKAGKDAPAVSMPTKEEMIGHLMEVLKEGKVKIKAEHIEGLKEGLEQTLGPIRSLAAGFRGGGDTVAAGSNITLTKDSVGNVVINAVAGSGSNVATQKLTGVQSGSNVTIDLAGLSHPFSVILGVYKNGQLLDPSDPSFGWSRIGNIITVLNGFDTDAYLISYTYA